MELVTMGEGEQQTEVFRQLTPEEAEDRHHYLSVFKWKKVKGKVNIILL